MSTSQNTEIFEKTKLIGGALLSFVSHPFEFGTDSATLVIIGTQLLVYIAVTKAFSKSFWYFNEEYKFRKFER